MVKKLFLIFISLFFNWLTLFAQADSISLNSIVEKTDKFSSEHPFEKVYLHFDKPYYAINDTIWFKVYLTIGPTHQLSVFSNIVYVDLISPEDSIFKTLKLPVINGLASGDIVLKNPLLKKGNYHLRAYTNWMRNFSPDYFFNKTISIGDAANTIPKPIVTFVKSNKKENEYASSQVIFKDETGNLFVNRKVNWVIQNIESKDIEGSGITDKNGRLFINLSGTKFNISDAKYLITTLDLGYHKVFKNKYPISKITNKTDVQFFPEGGELIEGVRSKVAFKVVDPNGLGVDVSGSVFDNSGNDVADFSTQHAGMGIFPLLPEHEKTYKAVINFPDGSKNEYELPKIRPDGINIALNNADKDNLTIKIATNDAYLNQYKNKGYYILAQNGATIFYTTYVSLQSKVYTAVVPKSKFPTGILSVTLMTVDGESLSERICFINRNDNLNFLIKPNLQTSKPLAQNSFNLFSKKDTAAVSCNFSIAVVDETKVPFNDDQENSILSNLLLSSDIKGFIEKPNYYFNGDEDKRVSDLDILLLTQGYRRFSYHEILENKIAATKFEREQGMKISGNLRTESGMPVFSGNVKMGIPDRSMAFNAVTDVEGHFVFQNVSLFDSTKIVLNARNNKDNDKLVITADAATAQPIDKYKENPDFSENIDSLLHTYLLNTKKQIENLHLLNEVVINSTRTEKVVHEEYPSLKGLGFEADQVIGQGMIKECGSDFEGCILSRVFGIWHVEEKYYIKKDYLAGQKKPIKFFVNGAAVDESFLSTMNSEEILNIEVYYKDGVSGLMRFYDCNGIISITTKSHSFSPATKANDLSFLTSQANTITITPKGYYKTKVFYSPKYTPEQIVSKKVIDLRSTIYWNPNLFTDKNGKSTISFFNALGLCNYKIVIEGIDAEGKIGRAVFHYQVN